MTDYLFQIVMAALVVAVWLEVVHVVRHLSRIEGHLRNIYHLAYYIYMQSAAVAGSATAEEEENEEKVKESCVLELVGRRGCVAIDEVVELCGVNKTFITHRLYRQKKVVKVDREGRVCPRE
jgi:hypothetical protein